MGKLNADQVRGYAVATGALPGLPEPRGASEILTVRAEALSRLATGPEADLPWPERSATEQRASLAALTQGVRHTLGLAQAFDAGVRLAGAGRTDACADLHDKTAASAVARMQSTRAADATSQIVPVVLLTDAPYPHQVYVSVRKHPQLVGQPVVLTLHDAGPAGATGRRAPAVLAFPADVAADASVELKELLASPQTYDAFAARWRALKETRGSRVPACCLAHAPKPPKENSLNCTLKNHNLALAADLLHAAAVASEPDTAAGRGAWQALKAADRCQARTLPSVPGDTIAPAPVRCGVFPVLLTLGGMGMATGGAAFLIRVLRAREHAVRADTRAIHESHQDQLTRAAARQVAVQEWERWLEGCNDAGELDRLAAALDQAQGDPSLAADIADLLYNIETRRQEIDAMRVCEERRRAAWDTVHGRAGARVDWPALRRATAGALEATADYLRLEARAALRRSVSDLLVTRATRAQQQLPPVAGAPAVATLLGQPSAPADALTQNLQDVTTFSLITGDALVQACFGAERFWLSPDKLGASECAHLRLAIRDTDFTTPWAIKIFHPGPPEARDAQLREARLAGRWGGGLGPVRAGFDARTETSALLMPLGRATSDQVASYLRDQGVPDSVWAHHLLSNTFEALAAMHAEGVVHSDIKAGNLMLDRGRRITFIDFGYACDLTAGEGDDAVCNAATDPCPPGFEDDEPGEDGVSPAADVWRMGLTALDLLAGHTRGYVLFPNGFPHNEEQTEEGIARLRARHAAFQSVRHRPVGAAMPGVDAEDEAVWRRAWQNAGRLAWPLNRVLQGALIDQPEMPFDTAPRRPTARLVDALLKSVTLTDAHRGRLFDQLDAMPPDFLESGLRHQVATHLATFHTSDVTEMDPMFHRITPMHESAVGLIASRPADNATVFELVCNMIERNDLAALKRLAGNPAFNLKMEFDGFDLLRAAAYLKRPEIVLWLLDQGVTAQVNRAVSDVTSERLRGDATPTETAALRAILVRLLRHAPRASYIPEEGGGMPIARLLQADAQDFYEPMLRAHAVPTSVRAPLAETPMSDAARRALEMPRTFLHTSGVGLAAARRTAPASQPSAHNIANFMRDMTDAIEAFKTHQIDRYAEVIKTSEGTMRAALNSAVATARVRTQTALETPPAPAPKTTRLDANYVRLAPVDETRLTAVQAKQVMLLAAYLEQTSIDGFIPAARVTSERLVAACGLPQPVADEIAVLLSMLRGDDLADTLCVVRNVTVQLLQRDDAPVGPV